ncbi:MAG: hypothetical protein ACPGVU_13985 [Limisphaerales bacterium]
MSQISLNIDPLRKANQVLNILTIESGIMRNDDRLHRLIDKIEQTGASVRRLFPSADIITVESTNDQFLTLQKLDEVTAANLHRMEFRPPITTEC